MHIDLPSRPHLRYHRLTNDAASRELARLVSGKVSKDTSENVLSG